MTRQAASTTEALMTDPTTEEGRRYWQERHDYEAALETPPGEAGDPLPPSRRPPGGPKRGRSAEDPGKVPADRTTTERQP